MYTVVPELVPEGDTPYSRLPNKINVKPKMPVIELFYEGTASKRKKRGRNL